MIQDTPLAIAWWLHNYRTAPWCVGEVSVPFMLTAFYTEQEQIQMIGQNRLESILLWSHLCSRDLQNISLPSPPLDRFVNMSFAVPGCYVMPTSQSPIGNSSGDSSGLLYISGLNTSKSSLCWKVRNIFFYPSDDKFAIGLCKASLTSITEQMKASLTILFQWLFCSFHLPIVLYSTGLPPLLLGVWLLAFSSCTTSSARQGTAVCIFLQVPKSQSAWVSSLAEDLMSSTDLWSHVLRLNHSVCDFTR